MELTINTNTLKQSAIVTSRINDLRAQLDDWLTADTFATQAHERKQSAIDKLVASRIDLRGDVCFVCYDKSGEPVLLVDPHYDFRANKLVSHAIKTQATSVLQAVINAELRNGAY